MHFFLKFDTPIILSSRTLEAVKANYAEVAFRH